MYFKKTELISAISNSVLIRGNLKGEIDGIVIDSRKAFNNCAFVSIKGKKLDGFLFAQSAAKNGASTLICNRRNNVYPSDFNTIITTPDTKIALLELASYILNKLNIMRIMITGSYGKTTTKEFLSALLSEKYNVLKTKENFNNCIGIPLSIFQAKGNETIGVFEVGMNHAGEIKNIVNHLPPDFAIITNIGPVHIENFNSIRDIAKAKLEILENSTPKTKAVINSNYTLLKKLFPKNFKGKAIFYNFNIKNNQLFIPDIKETYYIHDEFKHLCENFVPCIIIARKFGISYEKCQDILSNPPKIKGRFLIKKSKENIIVIDDSYNSNPISLEVSIKKNHKLKGRKIFVLGDMLELGRKSRFYHVKIGNLLKKYPPDYLFTIGKWSIYFGKNSSIKHWEHFKNNDNIIKRINEIKKEGDIILFKASRAFKLEEIIKKCFTF